MKVCLALSILLIQMIVGFVCFAGVSETEQIPIPARARAMGGAVTSLRDPIAGPLVQPASIAYAKDEFQFVMPQLDFESTSGFGSMAGDLGDFSFTVNELQTALASNPGQNQHLRVSSLLGVFQKNIALGAIPDFYVDELLSPDSTSLYSTMYFTGTLFANMAKEFGPEDMFSWGVTVKVSYRLGSNQSFGPTRIASQANDEISLTKMGHDGLGFGFDTGLLVHRSLSDNVEVSLGGSALNLGGLLYWIRPKLIKNYDKSNPRQQDMQVNAGASILWKNFSFFDWRLSFDVKHITRWSIGTLNHFCLGTELRFKKFLSILGGFQGRNWSGGVELRYWLLELHFVVYKEPIVTVDNLRMRNLRWLFEAQFVF